MLVTGGAGFIGSNITKELAGLGHKVKVIDNLSFGKKENLTSVKDKIKFIKADIRDQKMLQRELKGFDFVLHQAALRSVPGSFLQPDLYNEVNIGGTLNVFRAAQKNKIKRVVFASSSSVYGEAPAPQCEEMPLQPISPYALTKMTGEHYGHIFSKFFGLSVICLRYFNVYGPGQSLDDEYALVIPKFINCFFKNQKPPVFGTGRQSRDYIYIRDVVEANLLAALIPKINFEVFNVATGRDIKVLEIITGLNKIFKKNIKPKFLKPRPGDVFQTKGDISKISHKLHFKLKFDFQQGLEETVEWFGKIHEQARSLYN